MFNPLLEALFNENSSAPSSKLQALRARLAEPGQRAVVFVPPTALLWHVTPEQFYQDSYLLSHIAFETQCRPNAVWETFYGPSLQFINSALSLRLDRGFAGAGRELRIKNTSLWNPGNSMIPSTIFLVIVEVDSLLIPIQGGGRQKSWFGIDSEQHIEQQYSPNDISAIRSEKNQENILPTKRNAVDYALDCLRLDAPTGEELAERFRTVLAQSHAADPSMSGLALHEYAESRLGPHIFARLAQCEGVYSGFAHRTTKLQGLDLGQMDLPERSERLFVEFERLIYRAKLALDRLRSAHVSTEMGAVFLTTVEILGSSGTALVSADALLGLLVLTMVRCNVASLIERALFYVVHFSPNGAQVHSGKLGYALLLVESVLIHISAEHERLERLASANRELREAVRNADEEAIATIYNENPSSMLSRFDGESLLFEALDKPLLLNHLLKTYPQVFSIEFCREDRDLEGRSLLNAALDVKSVGGIQVILELLSSDREFLRSRDLAGRSAAHRATTWLINSIGSSLDWYTLDNRGYSPLAEIASRHNDDPRALVAALNASQPPYVDPQILHLAVRSSNVDAVIWILNKSDTDVNWHDSQGATSLMLATDSVIVKALRSAGADPWIRNLRGLTATELVPEELIPDVVTFTGQEVLSRGGNAFLVKNGENVPWSRFADLQKCFSHSSPDSWVPVFSDLTVGLAIDDRVRNEADTVRGIRVDAFLRLLRSHATFGPAVDDALAGRDIKIQTAEPRHDISGEFIDNMVTFFKFGIEQLSAGQQCLAAFVTGLRRVATATMDLNSAQIVALDAIRGYESARMLPLRSLAEMEQVFEPLNDHGRIAICLGVLSDNAKGLVQALKQPLEMVKSLGETESQLEQERERLHKLSDTRPWLRFMESRRVAEIGQAEESVFRLRQRLITTGRSLAETHELLASELATFNRFQGQELMAVISEHTRNQIQVNRDSMKRIERATLAVRETIL